MTAQQHYWDMFWAWCLAIGTVLALLVIAVMWSWILSDSFERRQSHRQRLSEVRLRAELAARGMDPDYLKLLEKKARGD